MGCEIHAGNILIKEGTLLPEALPIESEPCVPRWSLVKKFDGYRLDREIQKTGWTFFCLAGEIGALAFGMNRQKAVRRAVSRILRNQRSGNFNSLQITRIAAKRFVGMPYMSIDAQSRHIERGMVLLTDEESQPSQTQLTSIQSLRHGNSRGPASSFGKDRNGSQVQQRLPVCDRRRTSK